MGTASQLGTGGRRSVFAPHELASMQCVIDVVCDELGVKERERARRQAVAERVMGAFRAGNRQPLTLVQAGLAEAPARDMHA